MIKFKDRNDSDMVLSMTHEEVTVLMAMSQTTTYAKYPFCVYQIQTKFRDEARPRAGLIRVREFTMKDAYSFHTDSKSLDKTYDEFYNAYNRIYKRVGLENVIAVASDTGMMGGNMAHEYMLLCDAGEDNIVTCNKCDYSANMEVAYTTYTNENTNENNLKKIHTPDVKTIEALNKFTGIDINKMGKAVIYTRLDKKSQVIVFIRADREVNETKLRNLLKIDDEDLVPSKNDNKDIVYGFVGPYNLNVKNCEIVYDVSLKDEKSLIFGANEIDYHYINVSMLRDINNITYCDVAKVKIGDKCPICGGSINISKGIEVGNIFKLGDKYTKAMNMTYSDENGNEKNPLMGCYGIGIGRLMASVLEEKATDKATNWPASIAPFDIHICPIDYIKNDSITKLTDEIYNNLNKKFDVLLDDRQKSAGVKFADADLIGAPIRVVISLRNITNNNIEIKVQDKTEIISIDNIYNYIDMEVNKFGR